MSDNEILGETTIPSLELKWQPLSIDAAMPYLKAIGLLTALMIVWAGLCTI